MYRSKICLQEACGIRACSVLMKPSTMFSAFQLFIFSAFHFFSFSSFHFLLLQSSSQERMEQAFKDLICSGEEDTTDAFIIHHNVILYFLSRLLNMKLSKLYHTLSIPHCAVICIQEENVDSKTIPMYHTKLM